MHQRHELHRLESPASDPACSALDQHQVLFLGPHRRDHAAFVGELALEEPRRVVAHGRGDVDRVEGRLLGPALPPVADSEGDVVDPQVDQRLLGCLGQLGVPFDRVDVCGEKREQRRVVARAGAHVEHAVAWPEREHLEHARHHQRLGDRLAVADREGHVRVGAVLLGLRDEPFAGDARDRGQDALVLDRGAQQLRELGCLARAH